MLEDAVNKLIAFYRERLEFGEPLTAEEVASLSDTNKELWRTTELRHKFESRLNAGLPLTLLEWEYLSKQDKDTWEACLTEYQFKVQALSAYMLTDTLKGGTLAIHAVWDILPENVQEDYLKKWAEENAKQNQ